MITRQYQRILLEYLMQGQCKRKKERRYDYWIILLIRINRCKNDMKKDERPYDYCIILLIRITPCKNETKKDERRYDYNIILPIRITRCKKNERGRKEQQDNRIATGSTERSWTKKFIREPLERQEGEHQST